MRRPALAQRLLIGLVVPIRVPPVEELEADEREDGEDAAHQNAGEHEMTPIVRGTGTVSRRNHRMPDSARQLR